uniref:Uncharacterized protein n=1 Tax=Anguilla anguilla TaxID=7936 RepID=A0A0E9WBC4_ANGAN
MIFVHDNVKRFFLKDESQLTVQSSGMLSQLAFDNWECYYCRGSSSWGVCTYCRHSPCGLLC